MTYETSWQLRYIIMANLTDKPYILYKLKTSRACIMPLDILMYREKLCNICILWIHQHNLVEAEPPKRLISNMTRKKHYDKYHQPVTIQYIILIWQWLYMVTFWGYFFPLLVHSSYLNYHLMQDCYLQFPLVYFRSLSLSLSPYIYIYI